MGKDIFVQLRSKMVSEQLIGRGIHNKNVIAAFSEIKRELYVPQAQRGYAYQDCPLPIGENQTISQPYIVALMSELLDIKKGDKVLEIGSGSGYQSAVLAHLGAVVYSIERLSFLARQAKRNLSNSGYKINIKIGDGTLGWPEYAPYDKIIVTAAAPNLPCFLLEQLKIEGKIVFPLGKLLQQELTVIDKVSATEVKSNRICACVFVPLVGKYGYKE